MIDADERVAEKNGDVPSLDGDPFIDALWDRYRGRLTVGFGMPMFGTWRGNDDSALLNDLAARGFSVSLTLGQAYLVQLNAHDHIVRAGIGDDNVDELDGGTLAAGDDTLNLLWHERPSWFE